MRCDQAIFTSVRGPTGEGYRLVAASTGLTAEEGTGITQRSPSHDGLCRGEEGATAAAFYKLSRGRLCAALSCLAGREPSARGGMRVFTRAIAFDARAFSEFAYNPFNVLREMQAQGLSRPELHPPEQLPILELPSNPTRREDETLAAIGRTGIDWLSFILQAVYTGQRMILASSEYPDNMIEAVLLGLPGPLRENVSFANGLKFSIGRAFTLTGVTGDTTATERIIRGHPLALVRPQVAVPPPPFAACEWSRMVREHWAEAAYGELHEFTAQAFPDCSFPVLERVAALRNETNRASVSSASELLTLAGRRLAEAEIHPFERSLLADLLGTIRMRLEQIWSGAVPAELLAYWPALMTLVRRSPRALQQAIPLVELAVTRLAFGLPATLGERTRVIGGEDAVRAVEADLRGLVKAAERGRLHVNAAQVQQVRKALEQWQATFPGMDWA